MTPAHAAITVFALTSIVFLPAQANALSSINAGKTYYQVLGIAAGVGASEIKTAYRKSAARAHPDAHREEIVNHPEMEARFEELFKDIGEAYETLSDPDKRSSYDTSLLRSGAGLKMAQVQPTSSEEARLLGEFKAREAAFKSSGFGTASSILEAARAGEPSKAFFRARSSYFEESLNAFFESEKSATPAELRSIIQVFAGSPLLFSVVERAMSVASGFSDSRDARALFFDSLDWVIPRINFESSSERRWPALWVTRIPGSRYIAPEGATAETIYSLYIADSENRKFDGSRILNEDALRALIFQLSRTPSEESLLILARLRRSDVLGGRLATNARWAYEELARNHRNLAKKVRLTLKQQTFPTGARAFFKCIRAGLNRLSVSP